MVASPAPAGDESSPVASDEPLIRRYAPEPPYFAGKPLAIPRFSALIPNSGDEDGLSLNRERLCSAERQRSAAKSQNVREHGGVFAMIAQWLFDLKLDITPDPTDVPGHVYVPQMGQQKYATREGKKQIKDWADKLVRLVAEHGLNRILPTQPPPPIPAPPSTT